MRVRQCNYSRFSRLAMTVGLTALAGNGWAGEVPLTSDEDYCASMQQFIAGTDLPVRNQMYAEGTYDTTFKESKPTAAPLVSHQYISYQQAGGESAAYPMAISCKMKTAERIRTAHGGSEGVTVGSEDRSCHQWVEKTISEIHAKLESEGGEGLLPRDKIVLEPDNNVYIGPLWLRPHPYQVAYSEGGKLYLRSKVLHMEYYRFLPVPDSFMGTHYCHLVAPEYLARLVSGQEQAPPLAE